MPADEDTGIAPYAQIHLGYFRIPEAAGVGLVEQRHGVYAKLTGFEGERH